MSCKACDDFKAGPLTSGIRWKNANVRIEACDQHRAEVFAALKMHIGEPSAFTKLLNAAKAARKLFGQGHALSHFDWGKHGLSTQDVKELQDASTLLAAAADIQPVPELPEATSRTSQSNPEGAS